MSSSRVVKSVPMLDDAAEVAVRQWRFETTLLNGEPVEVEGFVTVNFTLSKSVAAHRSGPTSERYKGVSRISL